MIPLIASFIEAKLSYHKKLQRAVCLLTAFMNDHQRKHLEVGEILHSTKKYAFILHPPFEEATVKLAKNKNWWPFVLD